MGRIFARCGEDEAFRALVDLGLHHEQQHQELILTDIKHLLSVNPLKPAYHAQEDEDGAPGTGIEWLAFEGGLVEIGNGGAGFCFDYENTPPHHYPYHSPPATTLVTTHH